MKTLRRAITRTLTQPTDLIDQIAQAASDHEVLRERQSGLGYRQIAKKKGMPEHAVLCSLARTYANMRIRTMPGDDLIREPSD